MTQRAMSRSLCLIVLCAFHFPFLCSLRPFVSLRRKCSVVRAEWLGKGSSSAIAVSADGSRIFVSDYQAGLVRIINASTLEVTATVPVGVAPIGLDVTRDGRFVYVACSGSGTISAIDAASGAVIGVIAGGNGTFDVKLSPDGSRLYASNWYGGNVVIADAYNGSVLDSVQVTGWVGEGQGGINYMRLSPDGGRLYLADAHDNAIVIIGTSQRSIVRSVAVGPYPREFALSTNGSRLFVGQVGAGSIAAIALPDGVITANGSTPAMPAGIAYFSALELPKPTPAPNGTPNATPTPASRPSFLPTTTPTPAPTPTPTPVPIPGPVYGFPPGTVSQATPTAKPTPTLAPGTTPTHKLYFLGWDVPTINVSQEDMIVLILGGITAFMAVISILGFITVRKKMRPPEK